MTKSEIAVVLEEIATLLELKDENPFKIRAYANAARSIETFGGNLSDLKDEEALAKIPGIGKAIAAKVKELAETGSLKYLQELRAEFPAAILELFSIPGLGAKKIKALYEKLHISSIEQLQKACESGRVAELAGFGETTQAKICEAIARRAQHAGSFQLGQITPEAETLRLDLTAHPDSLHVDLAGSYRRRKEIVRDLDFVVATKKPDAITKFFAAHPLVESIIAQGSTKTSVRLRSGIQSDLRVVSPAEYPFALKLFYRQQGAQHRDAQSRAQTRLDAERVSPRPAAAGPEMKRSEDGQRKFRQRSARKRSFIARSTSILFRRSCVRTAANSKPPKNILLPKLIEKENLRGTFHCHTTASDGHNTLEEMAEAAQALGLQYLGIAEHSRSSIQAHGVDEAKLRAQIATIQKLNKKFEELPSLCRSRMRHSARRFARFSRRSFVRAGLRGRVDPFRFQFERSGHDQAHHSRDGKSVHHHAGASDRPPVVET